MFERNGYHFFTYRDVKVSVSPWYLLLMAYIAFRPLFMGGGGDQNAAILSGILFVVAVTISLIVHEFGHAFASKLYDLRPSILLHGFGGLCMHQPASSDKRDAFIVFAGPGIELVFGGLCALFYWFVLPQLTGAMGPQVKPVVVEFAWNLVWINIAWALINLLLPIWPLDGGQLFHLLLRRFMPETRAQDLALKVSIFVLVPAGLIGIVYMGSLFIAILAFFLLIHNVNALRAGQSLVGRQAMVRASDFQQELFEEAEAALADDDPREAYRLCHQLRSTGDMPAKMLDRVWEILTMTAITMERFDEARSYLKRAPDTDAIATARQRLEAEGA
jgi:Zn-dependent protease